MCSPCAERLAYGWPVRVLTLNILAPQHADWPRRRTALRARLTELAPDVVALQEVVDAAELVGPG
jgi:endonuclease/exonuclease/phosphatase family metal-dependent hydrolase